MKIENAERIRFYHVKLENTERHSVKKNEEKSRTEKIETKINNELHLLRKNTFSNDFLILRRPQRTKNKECELGNTVQDKTILWPMMIN